MKPPFQPGRALRTTHTPAIFDSGHQTPETHENTSLAWSTAPIEPVHARGSSARSPSAGAASGSGSRL